jgi:hypothetical protein
MSLEANKVIGKFFVNNFKCKNWLIYFLFLEK